MNNTIIKSVISIISILAAFVARGANTVAVSPIEGGAGDEVTVTVTMENSDIAGGMQVLIDLPAGSGCGIADGSGVALGRAEGFSVSAGIRDNRISAMLYSLDRKEITAGSGPVMQFKLQLGDKPIDTTLTAEVKLTDASGATVEGSIAPVTLRSLRPLLEITDKSIDFGRVPLTEKAQRTVRISNTGTAPMNVTGVKFDRAEFKTVSAMPMSVPVGGTASITVEFTPDERGALRSVAQIESNSNATYNVVEIDAIPYAVNTITIGTASGVSDSEVTIPVSMANMDDINGVTLEIKLPKQLEYTDGSFALNESRSTDHQFTATCTDGVLKIMVFSITNSPFKGNSGEIGSFKVALKGKGSYTVSASKAVLSAFYRGEVTNVLSDTYNGSVSIIYPTISVDSKLSLGRTAIPATASAKLRIRNYGNAPLTISHMDIDQELLKIDAELPLNVDAGGSADITISCAGETTGEIAGTLNIYSNDPDMRLTAVNVAAVRYADNHLWFTAEDTPVSDRQAYITVGLDNYTALKALQFDITYPADRFAAADNAEATGRAGAFQVTRRDISAGVSRYFIYSLSGGEIEPGTGDIIKLPFDLLDRNSTGSVAMKGSNFILSSASMENMNSQLTDASFNLSLIEKPVIKGDLDGNGKISIYDITGTIDIYLGKVQADDKITIIDMNDDGEVLIYDITAIVDLFLKN